MCSSPEFKKANSAVVMLRPQYKDGLPEIGSLIAIYKTVEQMIDEGKVLSAATPGYGGVAEALFKMCVGNHVGLQLSNDLQPATTCSSPPTAASILELLDAVRRRVPGLYHRGLHAGSRRRDASTWPTCRRLWEAKLEPVFPYRKAGADCARAGA